MKRTTSTALLLLFALLASSCGTPENQPPAETSGDQTSTDAPETAESLGLPSDLNYGDAEFTFLTRDPAKMTWVYPQLDVETSTGDVLNDAIYSRNRRVEDLLKVKISGVEDDAYETTVKNMILAGDDTYDIIQLNDRDGLSFAQEGLVYSISDLKYVDLDKPWWSQTLNSALSIGNKQYFAYGDYNLTTYDYTHVLVFNKDVAEKYSLGNIYDTVFEAKWTFDTYAELSKKTTHDLNGDSKMDENDIYGLISQPKHVLPCFWIGAGVESVAKNSDDIPVFDLDKNEKFRSVIEKIFGITWDDGSWCNVEGMSTALFESGHSLFMDTSFNLVSRLRDMDSDFGIIPYPKFDESQTNYYSRVEGGMVTIIPKTNDKLDMTGAVLEALAYESRQIVIPADYDIALKGKYARDPESIEMLDLIFAGRIYDLGDTYWCAVLRDGIFQDMFKTNNRDYSSIVAGVKPKIESEIQKTVEAFAALK